MLAAPFILSLVVREIVEKPCSSKDANSGLFIRTESSATDSSCCKMNQSHCGSYLKTVANFPNPSFKQTVLKVY